MLLKINYDTSLQAQMVWVALEMFFECKGFGNPFNQLANFFNFCSRAVFLNIGRISLFFIFWVLCRKCIVHFLFTKYAVVGKNSKNPWDVLAFDVNRFCGLILKSLQ